MSKLDCIKYDKSNDFYTLLDVKPGVKEDELKKSYHKLAMKHHPDKETGNEKVFKNINNAYDVLKDKKLRARYDQVRNEVLNPKKHTYASPKTQRDYRHADYSKSRGYYGQNDYRNGFKNDQEFYDFYSKNFYQKAKSGASFKDAKSQWERAKKERQEYYKNYQQSYAKDDFKSTGYNEDTNKHNYGSNQNQYEKQYSSSSSSSGQNYNQRNSSYKQHAGDGYYDFRQQYRYTDNSEEYKKYEERQKEKNTYEKWKKFRQQPKVKKTYKQYNPSTDSPFHYVNRRIMMNKIGRYTNFGRYKNFFKIINLKSGPMERMFSSAQKSFNQRANKETMSRGVINWSQFQRMFPMKYGIMSLFGLSIFYRALIKAKV